MPQKNAKNINLLMYIYNLPDINDEPFNNLCNLNIIADKILLN